MPSDSNIDELLDVLDNELMGDSEIKEGFAVSEMGELLAVSDVGELLGFSDKSEQQQSCDNSRLHSPNKGKFAKHSEVVGENSLHMSPAF